MAGDESTRDEPGDPVDQPEDHEPAEPVGETVDEPVDEPVDDTGEPVAAPVTAPVARRRRRRRVSKWDRPPEPHDWRWVVGGVGRVLVSVGILMFAFVAYQLWGTGIQEARAQRRLEDQFQEMLAAATTLPPATTTAVATTVPTTEPAPGSSDGGESTTSTTSTTTTTTLAPPAVLGRPAVLDPVGVFEIPAIGLEKMLVEGVTVGALERGPGHFPETPFPGQLGNAAVAGHRTTFGAPFLELDQLEPGDDIVVTTLAGTYTYVVSESLIVDPGDYAEVIPTTDPTVATLTLITCHPVRSTKHRLVVVATLDPARSAVVTLPTPADDVVPSGELPSEGEPATTGDTQTTTAAGPAGTDVPSTDAATAGTTASPDGGDTDPGSGAGTPSTEVPTTVPEDSATAFGAGWFHDPDAWPHVAVWGLVLVLISYGAYALSRRVRHDWVGALIGLAPFVVGLYFWFENVSRLLPPGL